MTMSSSFNSYQTEDGALNDFYNQLFNEGIPIKSSSFAASNHDNQVDFICLDHSYAKSWNSHPVSQHARPATFLLIGMFIVLLKPIKKVLKYHFTPSIFCYLFIPFTMSFVYLHNYSRIVKKLFLDLVVDCRWFHDWYPYKQRQYNWRNILWRSEDCLLKVRCLQVQKPHRWVWKTRQSSAEVHSR